MLHTHLQNYVPLVLAPVQAKHTPIICETCGRPTDSKHVKDGQCQACQIEEATSG